LRGSGHQIIRCFDEPSDQIGQAAGGVGGSRPALGSRDVEIVGRGHSTRLRGCGHPCSVATNDHQPPSHFSPVIDIGRLSPDLAHAVGGGLAGDSATLHNNGGCISLRP